MARKLLFWLLAALLVHPAAKAEPLAIVGARIVDVERGRVGPPSTVIIEGSAIVAAGAAGRVRVPREARRIDGRGRFLIPGLWDMGSFVLDGMQGVPGAMELMIAHGVVGTRDLGSAVAAAEVRALVAEIESGRRAGPKLIWTGRTLSRTLAEGVGSRAANARDIRSEAEAIAAVNEIADSGADYVRVVQNFPEAWLPAVVRAGRARNLPVLGAFVSSWKGAAEAGAAGFDHFADLYRISAREPYRDQFLRLYRDAEFRRGYNDRDRMYAFILPLRGLRDEAFFRAQLAALAAAGAPVTTDMATMNWAQAANDDLIRERARYAYPNRPREAASPGTTDDVARDGLFADVRALRDAGIPIMAGTQAEDAGHLLPGATLQDELIWMVRAGFTPREALMAATVTPARTIARLFPRVQAANAVAPGQAADLVMLDANPLTDIANIRGIHGVLANGRWFGPAERQALLDRAEALAAAAR